MSKKKKKKTQSKAQAQTNAKAQSKPQAQTKIKSQTMTQVQTRTKLKGEDRKKKQNKNDWQEIIYNCPYLLAVIITSFAVMIYSDEIGIRAIAREAETTIAQTMGMSISTQETALGQAADSAVQDGENLEILSENEQDEVDNAGECKEENNGIWDESDLNIDEETEEYQENTEKKVRGVTKFEPYEPQKTDSRYYSDAGKVALTTEYPYSIENDSYFKDAAFLGDSRTLGISDYAGLEDADFYCDSGMMIFKILEPEGVTYQKTGDKVDLSQVLQEKQYGKIYIMLGMNELGYGNTQMYFEQYHKVVDQIREWQPEAIIYIMANLHVSEAKNNTETEFNNININDKNVASARLANGSNIFYLDANPLFTDENGFLKAELSFDGVHLYAQHYDVWRQFLLEHAVEPAQKQETVTGENDVEQVD